MNGNVAKALVIFLQIAILRAFTIFIKKNEFLGKTASDHKWIITEYFQSNHMKKLELANRINLA